jgi:hypothetical protein
MLNFNGFRWRDDLNAQGVATHAVTSYRYMLDRQQPSHVVLLTSLFVYVGCLTEYNIGFV